MRNHENQVQNVPPPRPPPVIIEAAGQKYAKMTGLDNWRRPVTEVRDVQREINCRRRSAWFSVNNFANELFWPKSSWKLKVRLLKAEATEALSYSMHDMGTPVIIGAGKNAPSTPCTGHWVPTSTCKPLSAFFVQCPQALTQSAEVTIRQRRFMFAGPWLGKPRDDFQSVRFSGGS